MSFFNRLVRGIHGGNDKEEPRFSQEVKSEVQRITTGVRVRLTPTSRVEMPFSSLEQALGFAAFVHWFGIGKHMEQNRVAAAMFWQNANYSGRRVAVEVAAHCYRNDHFAGTLSHLVRDFDPVTEITLAIEALSSAHWETCVTRAIIMVCRNLAYAYNGAYHGGFRVPPGTTLRDLRLIGLDWIAREMDQDCAEVILGKNEAAHYEYTQTQAQKMIKTFSELADTVVGEYEKEPWPRITGQRFRWVPMEEDGGEKSDRAGSRS